MTERVPLFQEALAGEPFWMLVGCVLVNRAAWLPHGQRVHAEMRAAFSGPESMSELANRSTRRRYDLIGRIKTFCEPLGLAQPRAFTIVALAEAFAMFPPKTAADVMKIRGCGRYAAETWAIFAEGRLDFEPGDSRLREYVAWKKAGMTS